MNNYNQKLKSRPEKPAKLENMVDMTMIDDNSWTIVNIAMIKPIMDIRNTNSIKTS